MFVFVFVCLCVLVIVCLCVCWCVSTHIQVEVKTKKLKRLWSKYQTAQREIKDIQEEFQQERSDMLDTIRELTRQLRLKEVKAMHHRWLVGQRKETLEAPNVREERTCTTVRVCVLGAIDRVDISMGVARWHQRAGG